MPGIRHLQARIEGLIGPTQTWSINPKFSWTPTSIPTQTVVDGWCAAIAALQSGRVLPLQGFWGSAVSVTGVTASYINDAGTAVVLSKQVLASPASGSSAAQLPPQASVVTTLQTNVPGRRARGRLYWPLLATPLSSSTLRVSSSDTLAIATAVGTWLQDVAQAWPGPETIDPVVVSSVGGTATPIVTVRVGDVIDTQRRRRDQFLETYSTAPVV